MEFNKSLYFYLLIYFSEGPFVRLSYGNENDDLVRFMINFFVCDLFN